MYIQYARRSVNTTNKPAGPDTQSLAFGLVSKKFCCAAGAKGVFICPEFIGGAADTAERNWPGAVQFGDRSPRANLRLAVVASGAFVYSRETLSRIVNPPGTMSSKLYHLGPAEITKLQPRQA